MDLSQTEILNVFEYSSGNLYWKVRGRARPVTKPAGHVGHGSIRCVQYKGVSYSIPRLIWIYHNGAIGPNMVVKNKDKDNSNNDFDNLICVDMSASRAIAKKKKNELGIRNVYEHKLGWGFYVKMSKDRKIYTKLFKDIPSAVAYRDWLRIELHGPEVAECLD